MTRYKEVVKTVSEPVGYTCDICGTTYYIDHDIFEVQEFHHLSFIGGYKSIFGDEAHVKCDICQHCLKEVLGGFLKYNGS